MNRLRLYFDVETTGLFNHKLPADHPDQPRVCQLAAVLGRLTESGDGFEYVDRFEGIIKPDGWTVPDETAAIHGLTTEICMERGVPIADAMARWHGMYDQAAEILSYGIIFDTKGIRGESRRLGLPDRFGEKPELCVMRAATEPCKIPPTEAMMSSGRRWNKTPKLGEAHEILLGYPMKNAHDAMADVEGLIAVWRHLFAKGLLPEAKVRASLPPEQRPTAARPTAPEAA